MVEGGEDVVVSVQALSESRQKPKQGDTNAPKITAHFYLSPQIRAGVGECGAFKKYSHPTIVYSACVLASVCTCL